MTYKIKRRQPQRGLKRQRGEEVDQKIKFWKKKEAEEKRDKKIQDLEGRIRDLCDAIKWNNIRIIGIPEEEEEREKGAEGVLEQIIAENFPDLGKETGIEIQEAQRTLFTRNLN